MWKRFKMIKSFMGGELDLLNKRQRLNESLFLFWMGGVLGRMNVLHRESARDRQISARKRFPKGQFGLIRQCMKQQKLMWLNGENSEWWLKEHVCPSELLTSGSPHCQVHRLWLLPWLHRDACVHKCMVMCTCDHRHLCECDISAYVYSNIYIHRAPISLYVISFFMLSFSAWAEITSQRSLIRISSQQLGLGNSNWGFWYVAQAGLKFLALSHPPILTSQVARATGPCHCIQPTAFAFDEKDSKSLFKNLWMPSKTLSNPTALFSVLR